MCVCERERNKERLYVCACVGKREEQASSFQSFRGVCLCCVCACVCLCVCVCVCMCERVRYVCNRETEKKELAKKNSFLGLSGVYQVCMYRCKCIRMNVICVCEKESWCLCVSCI